MEPAFTVLLRNRPERTAFLFDERQVESNPAMFNRVFDEIVATAYRRWGARTTPVILFRDDGLIDDDWMELQLADVDRVISFSPLTPGFVNEIDRRLCPGELRVIDCFTKEQARLDIGMDNHGIEVSPIQAILKKFPADYLLNFVLGKDCPAAIRRFCAINFGQPDAWSPTAFPTGTPFEDSMLRDVQPLPCNVSNVEDLGQALVSLSKESGRPNPVRIVATCQIGFVRDRIPKVTSGLERAFQIIVGNAPADLLEHWNGVRWKQNWYQSYASQLWLPEELARDPVLLKAAFTWAHGYLKAAFHQDRSKIELVSWSWDQASLEQLKAQLEGAADGVEIVAVPSAELVSRRRSFNQSRISFPHGFYRYDDSDVIRLTGNRSKNAWHVPEPKIAELLRTRRGAWAADVLVEQSPAENLGKFREWWWLLPRKSGTVMAHRIFDRPARINRHGFFSLGFTYGTVHDKRPELKVTRPESDGSLHFYYWPRPAHVSSSAYDIRNDMPPVGLEILDLRTSDKGGYLGGLIALFNDLDDARDISGRRFWRETFERIANRDPRKDSNLQDRIRNLVTKKLSLPKDRQADVVITAGRIVSLVGERLSPKPVSASELQLRYERYAQEAGSKDAGPLPEPRTVEDMRRRPLSLEGMKQQLSYLVAQDIIRLGLEFRCEKCGMPEWIGLDRAQQHVTCSGCRHEQALDGAPEWHYGLNSLALRCVVENQLQVLQALCHLAWHAQDSFWYKTSAEIYLESERRKPWHEIDLVCLRDGELVVAEVKSADVMENDLTELAEIAEGLRADIAYLFMPPLSNIPRFEQWRSRTEERLRRAHVRLECVQLEQF